MPHWLIAPPATAPPIPATGASTCSLLPCLTARRERLKRSVDERTLSSVVSAKTLLYDSFSGPPAAYAPCVARIRSQSHCLQALPGPLRSQISTLFRTEPVLVGAYGSHITPRAGLKQNISIPAPIVNSWHGGFGRGI